MAHLAAALTRYRKRVGTRWRAHDVTTQVLLTIAWLEGGHTYRELGSGNGMPKSTCRTLIQEGIKVLARRALHARVTSRVGGDQLRTGRLRDLRAGSQ